MRLMDLFLATTHGPKTCLTSQGEHAHVRPSPKFSPVDMGYYTRGDIVLLVHNKSLYPDSKNQFGFLMTKNIWWQLQTFLTIKMTGIPYSFHSTPKF